MTNTQMTRETISIRDIFSFLVYGKIVKDLPSWRDLKAYGGSSVCKYCYTFLGYKKRYKNICLLGVDDSEICGIFLCPPHYSMIIDGLEEGFYLPIKEYERFILI